MLTPKFEANKEKKFSFRLTDAQYQKLIALGAARWIRSKIEKAKESK